MTDDIYIGLCVEATDADGLGCLMLPRRPQLHAKPALANNAVNADGIQKRIETGFGQFPVCCAPGDSETGAEHGCDMTLTGGAQERPARGSSGSGPDGVATPYLLEYDDIGAGGEPRNHVTNWRISPGEAADIVCCEPQRQHPLIVAMEAQGATGRNGCKFGSRLVSPLALRSSHHPSLAPLLSTVQTPNKHRHRLIRRPGLHLPIFRARLAAPITLEHIRPLLRRPLQHSGLPLQLLLR